MIRNFHESKTGARLILCENEVKAPPFDKRGKYMRMIWNRSGNPVEFKVDGELAILEPGQLISLTYLQHVEIVDNWACYHALLFNPEFYCIHTNDAEVSCNGLLFFGSSITAVVSPDESETKVLKNIFCDLREEFDTADVNQEEMLRILLKRLIIRCTRLARKQFLYHSATDNEVDTVRQFIIHVEENFRELHKVSDYAALMNKSPKTITNTFSLFHEKSPLRIIHERIVLEAKRQLLYTRKPLKQISYELGFGDPSQFSRLFRNLEGVSAIEFKRMQRVAEAGKNRQESVLFDH